MRKTEAKRACKNISFGKSRLNFGQQDIANLKEIG